MIKLLMQGCLVMMAYAVAFAAGMLDGRGIDLPWLVDAGFYLAFAMILICFSATEGK